MSFATYIEEVYRLSFDAGPDKQDWGTCFPILVKNEPRFVTAAHVFDKLGRPNSATVFLCSPAHPLQKHHIKIRYLVCDVAVFLPCFVPAKRCLPTRIDLISNMVVLVGYPRTSADTMPECMEQNQTKGIVDDTRSTFRCTQFSMNMQTRAVGPGNSGGPVFNITEQEEVVSVIGILSGGGTDTTMANNMIATRIDTAFQ